MEHLGHLHSMSVLGYEVPFHSLCFLLPVYLGFKKKKKIYRSCEIYALKRFCFDLFPRFVSRFRAPFCSSCSGGLVVSNSLICLSEKDCIFPSCMKLSFARYKILV